MLLALLMSQASMSQNLYNNNSWVKSDVFHDKVFIENKGQFDGKDKIPGSRILFGMKENSMEVFFTNSGLSYRYDVIDIPKELLKEMEEEREGKKKEEVPGELEKELAAKMKILSYIVNMEWVGANPNAEIVSSNIMSDFYAYGDQKNSYKANGYRKIMYKDLYPGIDLEYVFHEKHGIKYALILHPGADASLIKMKYSGTEDLLIDRKGHLHLKTSIGDITDHAPVSFYEKDHSSIVASSFINNNGVVSFKLGTYDKSKTLVIDPWTTGITMTSTNKALEVEKDVQGNVFILGGGNAANTGGPLVLKKYSAAGTALWTYTITTGGTGMYGDDLKLDKAGNAYVSTGAFGGYFPIWKISSAGAAVWSSASQLVIEPYRLSFDCNASNLFVTGGLADQNSVCYLNMNTGVMSSKVSNVFSPFIGNTAIMDDLRDWVVAPNGNYYGMTIGQSGPGRLFAFSPGFTPLWYVNHGYPLAYWSAGYTGHMASQPASMHLIAVNKNFIYTTSGALLQKRDLTTGAVLSAVTIPGGVLASNSNGNSGIVLDTCGNVYASSQAAVYKYDPNLVFIASAVTPAAVYDICLGNNGEILACGNGFVASLNLNACIPAPLNIIATATSSGNCLNGNTGSASVTTTGGSPTYNYYWIPGGQTTSSVAGLGAGTYSVIVTDMDCNTDTVVVVITSTGAPIAVVTQSNVKCNGGKNGSAAVSVSGGTSPYTYSWSTGNTGSSVTGLGAGSYVVSVTDANGCKTLQTVNLAQPLPFPVLTTIINTTCAKANGNVIATVNGSTGPYTYSWGTGNTGQYASGSSFSNTLSSGIYTVSVTDANGCSATASALVAASTTTVSASFTYLPNDTVCVGSTVNFTHTGNSGNATSQWMVLCINPFVWVLSTSVNYSFTFTSAGTYGITHTVGTGGGCFDQQVINIVVVNCTAPLISAASSVICPGSCATVSAAASGGLSPYTYSWNTGASVASISPCPTVTTTYTVKVTDANGATATTIATVSVNPAITLGVNIINILCNGNTNGSAMATAGGGASPYTYSWSNGQTSQNATALSQGTYTIKVTDKSGCTKSQAVTITQPSSINLQTSAISSSCGQSNGSASVTANGGTGNFIYSWSNGATTSNIQNVASNIYTITLTDQNGCTQTAAVSVGNSTGGVASISLFANVSCFGATNGSATATMTGGASPYTYSWSNGAITSNIQNVTSGIYTVTVTDNNGCFGVQTVGITQPAQLAVAVSSNNVSCFGGNSGSANTTVSGGTSPYTYSWSNGTTQSQISNLISQIYMITITDKNGCSVMQTVNITQPSSITLQASSISSSCGQNNGSASVTATGGTGNYTYNWSNGSTSQQWSSGAAGQYTVTITDNNGCTQTATVSVGNTGGGIASTTLINNVGCFGGSNGSVAATMTGGTSPYTYSWSNSATTQQLSNAIAGQYTVAITDNNGCSSTQTVNIMQPGQLAVAVGSSSVSCFGGNNGTATVSASGGTGAYTFSWSNGATTQQLNSATVGQYTVTITDNNGCTAIATTTIVQPSSIILQTSSIPATCGQNNGSASVTATGGTGNYTYSWSNGATTQQWNNGSAGQYVVTITDGNGCTLQASVTIGGGGLPLVDFSISDSSGCGSVCVQFTALGSGATFSWSFGDGATSSSASPKHCYTKPGAYDVTLVITDNNGCSNYKTKKALVNVYPSPVADFKSDPQPATIIDPVIHFTDLSIGASSWLWSFGDSKNSKSTLQNPVHTYGDTGCYAVQLSIRNQYGCKDSITRKVCIRGEYTFYAPNAFTPDSDGLNDLFLPKGVGIDPRNYELMIFDRWGNLIWQTTTWETGWDGRANGGSDIAQIDVYVWRAKTTELDSGKRHNYIGHVSIVR